MDCITKTFQAIVKQLPKNIGLFMTITLGTGIFADSLSTIISNKYSNIPELGLLIGIIFGSGIAFTVDQWIHTRGEKSKALIKLDDRFRATHQASELSGYYYAIADKRFSLELESEIRKLRDAQDEFKGELLSKTTQLAKQWKDMIEANERWRLLMQILVSAELNSLEANDFSMSLKTYLRILLTTIDIATSTANSRRGETLVVASFTNALPSDWFHLMNPVVGESMELYADELARGIDHMRNEQYSFKRYIMCSESLKSQGFQNKNSVVKDWRSCTSDEKSVYLSKLHSTEDDAYILDLYPEIKFSGKYTELIYFGFERGQTVTWNWCYACAYTSDNKNVSARFINLETEGNLLLIDVENIRKRKVLDSVTIPSDIKITFREFPEHFREIAKSTWVKNVVSLAKKWDIAAQIWHDDHEKALILDLLTKRLKEGASVLDCACGTGFHAILLHYKGFAVTATDIDNENIEILKQKQESMGINFNVQNAGWLALPENLKKTFDCVICLGSSITYYESWDERARTLSEDVSIKDVLGSLKTMLVPDGKLVLGISRHYDKNINGASVLFNPKNIEGHTYRMEWKLRYDWSKMFKEWECNILEQPSGNDYSFSLISHLIDLNDLMNICRESFNNVEFVDLDCSFYDVFLVCSNQ